MKRVAVARIWFEGNAFCPRMTTLADFQAREWIDSPAAATKFRNTGTELGGVMNWIDRHAGQTEVVLLHCCAAPPGGPLEAGVFRHLCDAILHGLRGLQGSQDLDGIYLSLHGAMLAEDVENPELALLQEVRQLVGPDLPLAISLDLHANLDPELAQLANIVIGYKTYPHVDMAETALRALDLLDQAMRGTRQPCSVIVPVERILPSHLMGTANGPMADIQALARALCSQHDLLDVTPFGGFAYADCAHSGASVAVCVDQRRHTEARQLALDVAQTVADALRARSADLIPVLPDAQAGLARACAMLEQGPGCVAVLDPADNPLSGGAADSTELFRELLQANLAVSSVFAFFYDPALVQQAIQLGCDAEFQVSLGGRLSAAFGAPVSFMARVVKITDGRFINDGPMEAGLACEIGPSVVLTPLDRPQLRVIVCSQCQSPNDLAWCRLHDIDLEQVRLFCVKAKNHFRAAFQHRLLGIIDIDAPGPAMLDLHALPYRFIQRQRLYPSPQK